MSAGERRRRREAITEALRDYECHCGQILEGEAAATVHADAGCNHPQAFGQLVRLKDGRWGQRWRHPEVK